MVSVPDRFSVFDVQHASGSFASGDRHPLKTATARRPFKNSPFSASVLPSCSCFKPPVSDGEVGGVGVGVSICGRVCGNVLAHALTTHTPPTPVTWIELPAHRESAGLAADKVGERIGQA